MRQEDPGAVQQNYEQKRRGETIYGFMVSLIGFGILFWLPGPEWLRHITGWLVVLFGGMFINRKIIKEWWDLFGSLLPFIGKQRNE